MSKHTKGEWFGKDGQIYSLDTGRTHVVLPYFDKDNEEHVANQALIAVAPELLAECLRAEDELASALRDGVSHFTEDMLRRWMRGVTDVIQKATNH